MIDACHLCHAPLDTAPTVHTQGRTGPLHTVACARCGLVQTSPQPTADEVREYYESGAYRREFGPLPRTDLETGHDVYPEEPRYAAILDQHAQHAALRLAAVLDVGGVASALGTQFVRPVVVELGCGDGRVSAALRSMGIDCRSIEADPGMRAQAEARGCVFDVPAEADVLFALQVIEHFADPVGELMIAVQRVRPGGTVYVEVPTVERPYVSLGHFFQRPHTVNYSTVTLSWAMAHAGLAEIETRIDGSVLCGKGRRTPTQNGRPETLPAWEPGVSIAWRLRAWETARQMRETLPRFLGGETLTEHETDLLRDEVRRYVSTAGEAIRALGVTGKAYDDEMQRVEDTTGVWDADPWQAGYLAGRQVARQHVRQMLGFLMDDLTLGINRPSLVLMMGAPGSGKTTVRKTHPKLRFLPCIDVDEIMVAMPDRPAAVAEAERLRIKAIEARRSFVIDATGKDPEIWKRHATEARALGYRVTVVMVAAELDVCARRVEERGRPLPEGLVQSIWLAVNGASFRDVLDACNGGAIFDGNGSHPELVAEAGVW